MFKVARAYFCFVGTVDESAETVVDGDSFGSYCWGGSPVS